MLTEKKYCISIHVIEFQRFNVFYHKKKLPPCRKNIYNVLCIQFQDSGQTGIPICLFMEIV